MADTHALVDWIKFVRSRRSSTRQTLAMAASYAAQVVLCSFILLRAYHHVHAEGVYLAMVSTALVVQPALEQAIGLSAVRVVANLVGGLAGVAVAALLGDGGIQTLLALVIVVFACEGLRLDLGMRTACVTTIIVMLARDGNVFLSTEQRCIAVFFGCAVAVVVQALANALACKMGWTLLTHPVKPPPPPSKAAGVTDGKATTPAR